MPHTYKGDLSNANMKATRDCNSRAAGEIAAACANRDENQPAAAGSN